MKYYVIALALLAGGCVAVDDGPRAAGDWTRTNADVHVGMARAALERRDWTQAEANAREALRIDAARIDAALLLGRAQLGRGDVGAAELSARRAVQIDESASAPRELLAECLLAGDHRGDARDAYVEAAARGSTEAGRVLGAMLFADGDEAAAAIAFRDADVKDGGVEGRALLAAHLRERGRAAEAERLFEELTDARPEDGDLRLALDQVRFERSDTTAVVDRVRLGDQAGRPAPIEDRLLAAAGLLRRGDGAEASRAYRKLAREIPNEPHVRLALGEALLLEHDARGAESAFLAATRIDPASRAAWVGVARARRHSGAAAAAIEPLERAVSLDPAHTPTRSLLVVALADAGDLERARVEAGELQIQDPGGRLDQACRRLLERRGGTAAEGDSERQP